MSKNIVVKIMEERLSEYGFQYEKYEAFRWTFSREVKEIKQYVVIQKDIWGGSSYILEIYTSAPSKSLRVPEFVKDKKYNSDFFDFENEDERIAVLNEIADIVIQYGIDELNKRSIPVKIYCPTDMMNQKLYEDQAILTQNYCKKHNITEMSENDILPLLKRDLEECYEDTYEQVQDKLVELAAVYGNLIMSKIGGQWRYNKHLKNVCFDSKPLYPGYPVLSLFVSFWQEKNADKMVENYIYTVSDYQNWVLQCKQEYGEDWEPNQIV